MERRVVITGMGIWSCLGNTLDEVRNALYKGKSGIVFSQERKDLGFRSSLCAKIEHPDLKPFVSRNLRQFMPEEAQYAYMATRTALADAKLEQDYIDSHEVGIIYGNDSVAEATMHALDKFREFHDTAACASGSHSVGLAYLLIRNGLQDCVVCGGAQEANLYSVAAFDGIQSFSVCEDAPEKASRPFDRDRDGLVPGGGAATLIVESCEHAVKRGAPILAEIVSWGFSGNGSHISTPNIEGPARSLELCLKNGNVQPEQIGYINAHATSTRIGDAREAQAIAQVFGGLSVPVTSTKSQTGHEMWMAGASELIYSILMMKNGFIAGNINFEHPDEDTACIHVLPETQEIHFDMFLSNSFGFGGTNSTLIVKDL